MLTASTTVDARDGLQNVSLCSSIAGPIPTPQSTLKTQVLDATFQSLNCSKDEWRSAVLQTFRSHNNLAILSILRQFSLKFPDDLALLRFRAEDATQDTLPMILLQAPKPDLVLLNLVLSAEKEVLTWKNAKDQNLMHVLVSNPLMDEQLKTLAFQLLMEHLPGYFDFNTFDKSGYSPLHIAAYHNDAVFFNLLFDHPRTKTDQLASLRSAHDSWAKLSGIAMNLTRWPEQLSAIDAAFLGHYARKARNHFFGGAVQLAKSLVFNFIPSQLSTLTANGQSSVNLEDPEDRKLILFLATTGGRHDLINPELKKSYGSFLFQAQTAEPRNLQPISGAPIP